MTGIVISTVVLLVAVVAAVVGLMAWSVASKRRREIGQTPSRPTSGAYRIPELTPDEIERQVTYFVPFMHLNDLRQADDGDDADARRVHLEM